MLIPITIIIIIYVRNIGSLLANFIILYRGLFFKYLVGIGQTGIKKGWNRRNLFYILYLSPIRVLFYNTIMDPFRVFPLQQRR